MDSPASVARSIANRPTRAERDAGLLQVGEAFRPLVSTLVTYMLAGQICELPTREARKSAVLEVPCVIVDDVCALVTMRFQAAAELRRRASADAAH